MGGSSKGGGGDQSYVVGYKYFADIHLQLCHGTVDVIPRAFVGDACIWNFCPPDDVVPPLVNRAWSYNGSVAETGKMIWNLPPVPVLEGYNNSTPYPVTGDDGRFANGGTAIRVRAEDNPGDTWVFKASGGAVIKSWIGIVQQVYYGKTPPSVTVTPAADIPVGTGITQYRPERRLESGNGGFEIDEEFRFYPEDVHDAYQLYQQTSAPRIHFSLFREYRITAFEGWMPKDNPVNGDNGVIQKRMPIEASFYIAGHSFRVLLREQDQCLEVWRDGALVDVLGVGFKFPNLPEFAHLTEADKQEIYRRVCPTFSGYFYISGGREMDGTIAGYSVGVSINKVGDFDAYIGNGDAPRPGHPGDPLYQATATFIAYIQDKSTGLLKRDIVTTSRDYGVFIPFRQFETVRTGRIRASCPMSIAAYKNLGGGSIEREFRGQFRWSFWQNTRTGRSQESPIHYLSIEMKSIRGFTPPKHIRKINVQKGGIFGGVEREGGVSGDVYLMDGHPSQERLYLLAERKGIALDRLPAYRGVAGVFFHDFYWSNNPYLKPVTLTAMRTKYRSDGNVMWQDHLATWPAGHWSYKDLNPAHIIQEAYTDTVWGLGISPAMIGRSFLTVAQQLHAEGSGLSIVWSDEMPVEDFVAEILRTIDGVIYQHPVTAQYEFKLIRNDYDRATLPVINPSNSKVVKISDGNGQTLVNQITVKFSRRYNPCASELPDQDAAIVVQNGASIQQLGRVINQTMDYPGISCDYNAYRVGLRDLAMMSQPLKTFVIECNRSLFDLMPGDVALINDPDNGIVSMAVRINKRAESSLADGKLTLECIQDVFETDYTEYSPPTVPEWDVGKAPAKNFPAATATEAPYGLLVKLAGSAWNVDQYLEPGKGLVAFYGALPDDMHTGYKGGTGLYDDPTTSDRVELSPVKSFNAAFYTTFDIGATDRQIFFTSNEEYLAEIIKPGMIFLVGAVPKGGLVLEDDKREIIQVESIDVFGAKLKRGIWDTSPQPIKTGTWLFLLDQNAYVADGSYIDGQAVTVVGVPRTFTDLFAPKPPADPYYRITVTVSGRRDLPYPPANVRLNGSFDGERWIVAEQDDLTLEWCIRDKVVIEDNGVDHYDPNNYVGPLTNLQHVVRWRELPNGPWTEHIVAAGMNSFTLTKDAERAARNKLRPYPSSPRLVMPAGVIDPTLKTLTPNLEIEVRALDPANGMRSINPKTFLVHRIGYGYNMGIYYGGSL